MVGASPADSSGEDFMAKIMAQDEARMKEPETKETEEVAMETEPAETVQEESGAGKDRDSGTPDKHRSKRTVRGVRKHKSLEKREDEDEEESGELSIWGCSSRTKLCYPYMV